MLKLTKIAKKRASYAERSGMTQRAAKILASATVEKPTFIEDADGHRVREWHGGEWRSMTNEDVKKALHGQMAVEDEDLLEYIPPQTIKDAVSRGWLVKTGPFYRVTKKARDDLNLATSVGGRKIVFWSSK